MTSANAPGADLFPARLSSSGSGDGRLGSPQCGGSDAHHADTRAARDVDRRHHVLVSRAAVPRDVDDLLRAAGIQGPKMLTEPARLDRRPVDAIARSRPDLQHDCVPRPTAALARLRELTI